MIQNKNITAKRKRKVNEIDRMASDRYLRIWPNARKSDLNTDRFDHIDFWHTKDGETFGVDIKGNKLPSELWIEFKNVNGDDGWMYGKAKWIAFEIPDLGGFAIVLREELKDWAEKNVDTSEVVTQKWKAYKRVYSRSNWKAHDGKPQRDRISMITVHDLREVPSYRMVKYSTSYKHPVNKTILSLED